MAGSLRFAFVGFRHGHIFSLFHHVVEHSVGRIVGICEEDPVAREQLNDRGISVTHTSYEDMLQSVECDVIACGDYYSIRGARLTRAMETGHHVISDKPLCTSLDELAIIRSLSLEKSLCVGCMLDLSASGVFLRMKELVEDGRLGEVHSIVFLGQHPLLYGKRAGWYFEPGKHGGTINDIGIHAIDIIPFMTGRRIVEVTAARVWNAKCKAHPHFQDGAAFMLKLDNNGTAMGDVSYLSSDRHGYTMPAYWRFTLAGSEGVAEASCTQDKVLLWDHVSPEPVIETALLSRPAAYLEDFCAEIKGAPNLKGLTTHRVLESSRIALLAQKAADDGVFPQSV